MPSLRRTASSPAVRSSPYSSGALAARAHGPRRSSGSETSSRRVLADIEWWRVTDGQCDSSADQETEDPNRGTQGGVAFDAADLAHAVPVTHVDASVEHPVALPLPWVAAHPAGSLETPSSDLPTEQFSSLSITPHTPTRRRYHTLESSASSLESSPEAPQAPSHALGLGISGLELNFMEDSLPALPLPRRNRYSAPAAVLRRSFTVADCVSLEDDHASQYADFAVSPLSSAPDFLN